MKNILFITITLAAFVSCKNSKQAAQTNSTAATTPTMATPEPAKELPDSIFRLKVTFISIGEGIDGKAVEQMEEIMVNHQRDFGMPLAKEEFRWGREGEIDYCFKLKNSDRKAQDTFVRQIREKFSENKLVQIQENAVCRNRR